MIERVRIECTTKAAAEQLAAEINEALAEEFATADGTAIDVVWTTEADPSELFEALVSARESLDWDFE